MNLSEKEIMQLQSLSVSVRELCIRRRVSLQTGYRAVKRAAINPHRPRKKYTRATREQLRDDLRTTTDYRHVLHQWGFPSLQDALRVARARSLRSLRQSHPRVKTVLKKLRLRLRDGSLYVAGNSLPLETFTPEEVAAFRQDPVKWVRMHKDQIREHRERRRDTGDFEQDRDRPASLHLWERYERARKTYALVCLGWREEDIRHELETGHYVAACRRAVKRGTDWLDEVFSERDKQALNKLLER